MILTEQISTLSNELPADFRAAIRSDVANLEQRLRTMFIKRGPIPYDRGQVFTVSDLRRNEAQWGRVARLGLLLHCFSEDLRDFRFTNRENLDPDILERVGLVPDGSGDVFAASGRPDRDAVTEIIGVWQSLRFRLECRERAVEENQGVEHVSGLMNMTEDNIFNLAVDEWQQQRESQCPVCDCLVKEVLPDCPGCNSSWAERELHRANASATREIHTPAQILSMDEENKRARGEVDSSDERASKSSDRERSGAASSPNTKTVKDPAGRHKTRDDQKRDVVIEAPIENSWTCGSCTCRNKMSDKCCRACDGPSPAIDKWPCEKCTVHNDKLAEKCMGCEEANPHRANCSMCMWRDVYTPDGPLCRYCTEKVGRSSKCGECGELIPEWGWWCPNFGAHTAIRGWKGIINYIIAATVVVFIMFHLFKRYILCTTS